MRFFIFFSFFIFCFSSFSQTIVYDKTISFDRVDLISLNNYFVDDVTLSPGKYQLEFSKEATPEPGHGYQGNNIYYFSLQTKWISCGSQTWGTSQSDVFIVSSSDTSQVKLYSYMNEGHWSLNVSFLIKIIKISDSTIPDGCPNTSSCNLSNCPLCHVSYCSVHTKHHSTIWKTNVCVSPFYNLEGTEYKHSYCSSSAIPSDFKNQYDKVCKTCSDIGTPYCSLCGHVCMEGSNIPGSSPSGGQVSNPSDPSDPSDPSNPSNPSDPSTPSTPDYSSSLSGISGLLDSIKSSVSSIPDSLSGIFDSLKDIPSLLDALFKGVTDPLDYIKRAKDLENEKLDLLNDVLQQIADNTKPVPPSDNSPENESLDILRSIKDDTQHIRDYTETIRDTTSIISSNVSSIKADTGKMKEDLTGIKDDTGKMKDDLTGIKDDTGKMKEDLTGIKDSLANPEKIIKEPISIDVSKPQYKKLKEELRSDLEHDPDFFDKKNALDSTLLKINFHGSGPPNPSLTIPLSTSAGDFSQTIQFNSPYLDSIRSAVRLILTCIVYVATLHSCYLTLTKF